MIIPWYISGSTTDSGNTPAANPQPQPQSNPAFPAGFKLPTLADSQAQLGQIMAPYQQMAKQFTSTMPGFSPQSDFPVQHPQLARFLSNLMVAEANTGTGRTIGENIGNVARGAMAPAMMQRQMALQAAMLPYQMAGPQIDMLDKINQANQRAAMLPLELSRANYYMGIMGERERHDMAMEDIAGGKGALLKGSDGRTYQNTPDGVIDSVTRQKVDPQSGLSFSPFKPTGQGAGSQFDQMISKREEELGRPLSYKEMVGVSNDAAAGRAAAVQSATEPQKLDDNFMHEQGTNAKNLYPNPSKLLSQKDWNDILFKNTSPIYAKYGGDYDKYYKGEITDKKQEIDRAFGQYRIFHKSGDRTTFSQWYDKNPMAGTPGYVPDNPYPRD